jgi:hypothetical protein
MPAPGPQGCAVENEWRRARASQFALPLNSVLQNAWLDFAEFRVIDRCAPWHAVCDAGIDDPLSPELSSFNQRLPSRDGNPGTSPTEWHTRPRPSPTRSGRPSGSERISDPYFFGDACASRASKPEGLRLARLRAGLRFLEPISYVAPDCE